MIFPGSFVTFVIDIILTSDFHLWSVPRLGRDREDQQNQNPELEPTMEFLEVCFAILKLHGFSTLRIQDPTTTVQDEDNVGLKADEGWSPLGGLDFRIFPTEPMWSHYQILVQDSKFSQDWRKFGSLGSLSSMEFFLVSTNWRVVSLLDPFRGFPPDPGGSSQILQRSQKARDTLDESTESRKLRCWPFLGGTHDFQRCALYSFMTWTCEASTLLRSSNSNQKKSRPPGCGACGIMSSVCLTLVLTYQWDIICHLWKCWSILKPEAPRHQTSDVLQRSAPNSQCLTKEGFKPSISTQFHQNLCMQLSAQIQDASIFSYIYRFVLRSDVVLQKSNPRSTKPGHQVARVAQLLVGWLVCGFVTF